MTELIAGVKHIRDGVETQNILGAERSVIGIVGTAANADATKFPLNKAVELTTADATLRAALGAVGTLPQALEGLSAQVAGSAGSARAVLVRVAEGANAAETIVNIVGNEAARTGMWALLDAPEDLGVVPGIIIIPGFTSQQLNGVDEVTISSGGSGYTTAPTVVFTGGGGTGAAAIATVDSGAVTAITVTNPGSGYTSAPTISFTGGGGTSAAASSSLTALANAVCASIPTVLERLKADFIPEGPTNTRQAWLNWLETLPRSGRFFHPLRQDAKVLDASGQVVTRPLSPYVAGLYPRRDSERDGVPSGSTANQPVYGLVGVTPSIPFSLTDETSQGQADLAVNAGIVIRGESGVASSISDGGFVFWGTDTLAEESEWLFTHVNRLRDYIELGQVRAVRRYLGKLNITVQTVQAVVNTLDDALSILQADGHILDKRVFVEPNQNAPTELRAGQLTVTFKAEEPPVLRKIVIRSHRYPEALTGLMARVSVALGSQS